MANYLNGVVFLAAATGTGTFTVSTPVQGWRTPAQAAAVDGASYRYRAQNNDGSEWEIGTGVYTVSGTTLTRAVITASSNANAVVNFTQAPKVTLTIFAEDFDSIVASLGTKAALTDLIGNSEVVLTANTAITLASHNKKVIVGNSATTITLTLNTPSALTSNYLAVFTNINTGDVVLSGTFDDGSSSFTLEKGQSLLLSSNGTVHRLLIKGAAKGNVVPLSESGLGNGTATITLANTPASADAILLFIGGVPQAKGMYSISGNVITAGGIVAVDEKWIAFHLKGGAYNVGLDTVYAKYTGTNSAGPFNLPVNPPTFNSADFTFGGLPMPKDGSAYTLNFAANPVTVTFSEAVANTSYWDVEVKQPLGIGVANPDSVGISQIKAAETTGIIDKLFTSTQTVASAGTVSLAALNGPFLHVSGTTTITSFGTGSIAGIMRILSFDNILTLTHGSNLILPGSANIVTSVGDQAIFILDATPGIWRCVSFTRRNSPPSGIGTVSQTSGVPTGAIIEQGSNVNGLYTKYADGTMICAFKDLTPRTISTAAGVVWSTSSTFGLTFAATFISEPVVCQYSHRDVTGGVGNIWVGSASSGHATTTLTRGLMFSAATGGIGGVGYIAYGRWF